MEHKFERLIRLSSFLLVSTFYSYGLVAQDISGLVDQLKDVGGVERLEILHTLTNHYTNTKDRKSIKYGKQAVKLADNLFSNKISDNRWIRSYFLLGKAYYSQQKYYTAKETFIMVDALVSDRTDSDIVDHTSQYLLRIDSIANTEDGLNQNFFSRTFSDVDIGGSISEISSNVETGYLINQAQKALEKGELTKAIENYRKAAAELDRNGELEQLAKVYREIGSIYRMKEEDEKSKEYYQKAFSTKIFTSDTVINTPKTVIKTIKESDSMIIALAPKGYTVKQGETEKPLKSDTIPETDLSTTISQLEVQTDRLQELSKQAEKKQDFETLVRLRDQIAELERDRLELEIIERERNLLVQDMRIAELTLKTREEQLSKESKLRKGLVGGSLVLAFFLISMGVLYSAKKRDHKKLSIAYNNLDKAKNKLLIAEERIKTLLNQQVSGDIANELIQNQSDHPSKEKFVCIIFLDIRDFTPKVEGMDPEEIINYQNEVFGSMIDIVYRYKGIINQFLGDGFMATFGAPMSRGNDCQNAYDASREIINTINEKSENKEIPETRLGIGLHAGLVVTGNVGTDIRKQYSITGSAVIIASRLEQLNKEFNTQLILSEEVFRKLDDPPVDSRFKLVKVKGVKEPLNVLTLG